VVESEGGVITYKKIIHRPHITLPAGAGEKEIKLARKLAEKAESSCMITRAIIGNVEVELETSVIVAE
jgi:peroxiredoxin-like protein